MKKIAHSTVWAGICASAFCLTSAHAQQTAPVVVPPNTPNTVATSPEQYTWSSNSRFYIGADAGGLITGDTRVKEFFGPVNSGTKVALDPGARFGLFGGYKLTDWFSVEGETGLNINPIKSITGASIDGDARLSNIPLLANVRLQIPHGKCPVTPYIGGGAGGSASIIGIEHEIELNGVDVHGSDASWVWAWQAFATPSPTTSVSAWNIITSRRPGRTGKRTAMAPPAIICAFSVCKATPSASHLT